MLQGNDLTKQLENTTWNFVYCSKASLVQTL